MEEETVSPDVTVFAIVFVAAMALFGWSCFSRFRLVAVGKPEDHEGITAARLDVRGREGQTPRKGDAYSQQRKS